jgi:hypothetical protein
LQGSVLGAFDVELIVDLLFDVGAVRLEVDEQTFTGLFDLIHNLYQISNQGCFIITGKINTQR